jgi:hypothetical protein
VRRRPEGDAESSRGFAPEERDYDGNGPVEGLVTSAAPFREDRAAGRRGLDVLPHAQQGVTGICSRFRGLQGDRTGQTA